ncbi:single-stranded DNA-binding protein [Escherichia coli]|uniref:single-stranded DNA-binding protein n=1 Tax=Escherichia coli TaxID=562 RepID=UPI001BCF2FA9|nr:single-stranded DNA-binding protein [Escherichia coli]EHK7165797.1 single-stranded DNA-binding protein [Escherichia coli]EIG4706947.1 single-stranded DNA-binding protein [Escherichia coli]EJB3788680.1 single-stranded DNA-binding protein [Escherichia coli]MBS8956395.1 single-stranded DNA-binding protein [Escherichia coli]
MAQNSQPQCGFTLSHSGSSTKNWQNTKKGDLVQVHGNLQVNRYQDKFGQQKEGWQLLAQSIISSRTAR